MRIALVAIDTRGGVQPYLALGLGLQQAGHHTTLLTPSNFTGMATARGLPAVPLSGDVEQVLRGMAGMAEKGANWPLVLQRSVSKFDDWSREVLAACLDTDLIVAGFGGGLVASAVAERLGCAYAQAHLQPVGPPTAAFPGVLAPSMPRRLWPLSHRVTAAALTMPFAAGVRHARTRVLGLPARRDPARRPIGTVYGYSRHVLPAAPEWGPDHTVTGYWTLASGESYTPPAVLADFLAAGDPPVCVGFGSMGSADPPALFATVLTAVKRAGVRAILLSGWGALAGVSSERVLVIDEAPHDWLFAHAAAVVHHGGAGTTGASLRAGVPTLVVPFAVDQPFWGRRVAALGVGPAPIPRRGLSADRLAAALTTMLVDQAMRQRAAELGAAIRAEQGVPDAVRALEAFAA